MNVQWVKCAGDDWCDLFKLDLGNSHFDGLEGVYIIWSPDGPIVRVGQGIIQDRLREHRKDPKIIEYGNGTLTVTWAQISSQYRDGVEKFLGDTLKPKVGTAFPDVYPVSVNLPWPWQS